MTRREAERLTRQADTLRALGVTDTDTYREARALAALLGTHPAFGPELTPDDRAALRAAREALNEAERSIRHG